MKSIYFIIAALLNFCLLFSITLPFSSVQVKKEANLLGSMVRIDPSDQKAEMLHTSVWFWYDEDNLYALFEARIDSSFCIGKYAARDLGTQGDYIYVNIIPNTESYNSYFFAATPTGSLADGTRDISAGSSYQWNSSYTYTTEIIDSFWVVVFKIPFKDMRFRSDPPYKWKVKVTRYLEYSQNYYAYPYYNDNDPKEYYLNAVDVTMTNKIKRYSDWKFRPYYVKSYDLVNRTDTFDPENIGIDVSFNPSTRTKLKATLNPDFTDVPPDDAADIYNNKYPTYYSENRFFFVEDINAFAVASDLFNTRNIVQPQFAVKFTGAQNTFSYGYLCAKDRKIVNYGNTINRDDFYQMLSLMKTKSNYKAHISLASRTNKGYYNNIIVGDWDWEILNKTHIGSSHLVSFKHTEEVDNTDSENLSGLDQSIYVVANPGNWNFKAKYINTQNDVRVDMGYYYDTGFEGYIISSLWASDPKEKLVKRINCSSSFQYVNRLERNYPLSSLGNNINFRIDFLPKYAANLYLSRDREVYEGKEHDTFRAYSTLSFSKWIYFVASLTANYGKTVIYSLNQAKQYYYLTGNVGGNIERSMSWSLNLSHYQYDYDKINTILTQPDTLTIQLDDCYQIANASLNYDFSNHMSIYNGLAVTTYQTAVRYSKLFFYSNFRYEFCKDWFLYLGYKTSQIQDEPSIQSDWNGHFNRTSASAYLKLSAVM